MNQLLRRIAMALEVMAAIGIASVAIAQEPAATVRTYEGVSYTLSNVALEVSYTIGELKEKESKDEQGKFAPAIQISTAATSGGEGGKAAAQEKEPPMLRARRELTEVVLWREAVQVAVPLNQIRAMNFSRRPVDLGLPGYLIHYRNVVNVSLVNGDLVNADYVNLGTTVFRGTGPAGTVRIPWDDVMQVTFDR